MKKIIYTLLILSGLLSAQRGQWGGSRKNMPAVGQITGIVVDSLSQNPIEYVSISVMNKRSKGIETGGITNSDGRFDIREIKPGRYSLKIEFMGFASKVIPNVELSFKGSVKQDVGIIRLQPVLLEYDAVNVIEDRPLFEFETDKMIYNSSDDIISDSGTAEDVLNKVPMVTVDQDGSVALRGNSNVKILVNGRQNRTGESSSDVDNIPASLIEKVEVITSPSAKYDPDGMAGIINIVLKKGKYEGLNGNIKINGSKNNNFGFGGMNGFTAYGNYKTHHWNLYSSINLNNRMRLNDGHRKVNTTYFATDSTDYLDFSFTNASERVGKSIKFGADYMLNEHIEFNAEFNYDVHVHNGDNEQTFFQPFEYVRNTTSEDFDDNYDVEGVISMIHSFDNPDREFSALYAYDYAKDRESKMLVHTEDLIDTTYLSEIFNKYDLDISYLHPINENSKFEFGYDGRFANNNEIMDFNISEEIDEYSINTFSGLNTFGYKRNIHSIFFEYSYALNEKFSIKPSFRFEYIDKKISFKKELDENSGTNDIIYAELLDTTPDSIYEDSYSTFYPDLHFTYNLTDKQSIQFGLSQRVNRPGDGGHGGGSRQIRPFPRDLYAENFIFVGNPFLKPEYSTQYDLSFKSPMPMGFGYVNLYYHQLTNIIEWYDDDRFENSDILTFKNADSGENFGVELFTMVMGQTLGGGYNYQKMEDPSGDYELNGNDQRINMYSRINLPEKFIKYFDFEFGFYYMKMIVPGGTLFGDKGTIWANIGISKTFYDDRATVSLSVRNLFDQGGFQMQRTKDLYDATGGFIGEEFTDVYTTRGGRTLSLNFKFRFGKMQDDKRKTRHGGGDRNGGEMDMGY